MLLSSRPIAVATAGVAAAVLAVSALHLSSSPSSAPSAATATVPATTAPIGALYSPTTGASGAAFLADGTELNHSINAQGVMSQKSKRNTKGYSYLSNGPDGKPARWNACKTVTYSLNTRGMSKNMKRTIPKVLKKVSQASGIKFRKGAPTRIVPFASPQWSDSLWNRNSGVLVIAAASAKQFPMFANSLVSGYGGNRWQGAIGGAAEIRVGGVLLNRKSRLDKGFSKGPVGYNVGQVLLHEIGHAMNLGHAADEEQVMFPIMSAATPNSYAAGDLAGFRGLSSKPCF